MQDTPMITLNEVKYTWPKQSQPTIDIPSLTFARNSHVFIKGPSGCGKSTLLGLLTGILSPQSGELNILNRNLAQLTQSQRDSFRADHIGYIFQQFNLLPYLSMIDNVLLPCRFSSNRGRHTPQKKLIAQAENLLTQLHLPQESFHKTVTELSIGQQQRVAAARALIGAPPLIIADEPTSSLDYENRSAFIELLMQAVNDSGATLIFVSHDPTLEQHFDRTIDLTTVNTAT